MIHSGPQQMETQNPFNIASVSIFISFGELDVVYGKQIKQWCSRGQIPSNQPSDLQKVVGLLEVSGSASETFEKVWQEAVEVCLGFGHVKMASKWVWVKNIDTLVNMTVSGKCRKQICGFNGQILGYGHPHNMDDSEFLFHAATFVRPSGWFDIPMSDQVCK